MSGRAARQSRARKQRITVSVWVKRENDTAWRHETQCMPYWDTERISRWFSTIISSTEA